MSIKLTAFFRGALHWTITSDITFQSTFRSLSGLGCNKAAV